MAITKVWIEEGCILCGVCEATATEAFEMSENTAILKNGINFSEYEDEIKDAADHCPVSVIKYS